MLPDYDGCLNLLEAIGKQWMKEALTDAAELDALAWWLDMSPVQLQERIDHKANWSAMFVHSDGRHCPGCGSSLPQHNASETGQGRQRLYCDGKCRYRALQMRQATGARKVTRHMPGPEKDVESPFLPAAT